MTSLARGPDDQECRVISSDSTAGANSQVGEIFLSIPVSADS